jgi:short-subunit dehydrogenase
MLSTICAITGFGFMAQKTARMGRSLYNQYYNSISINHRYGHKSWAMVTGGADGIGRAHAEILAKDWKFNLVIVDRDDAMLKKVKEDLGGLVEVHTIKADLMSADGKVFEKVWKEASQKDVSIVMNNVGTTNFEKFHEKSAKQITNEVLLICFPTVYFSKLALASFKGRKETSALINVASIGGRQTFPHMSNYCGAKHFVFNFTEGL